MDASQLKKLSESYATIAEGGKHEKSAMDWNKSDDKPKGKKVDKKKVDKCTCESFYLKRLKAMDPAMAENYLSLAEILIEEGYQSSRLIDNLIEALPKDVIGEEFRAALHAVNPRIYENLDTAEKRQARAIIAEFNLMQKLRDAKRAAGNFFSGNPQGNSVSPEIAKAQKYRDQGGKGVPPSLKTKSAAPIDTSTKSDTKPATPSSATVASKVTDERSPAANDAKQQAAKQKANQSKTTPTKERSSVSAPKTNKDGSASTRTGASNGATPMQQWAKNFPSLASKVKSGASGSKEISSLKNSHEPEGEMTEGLAGMVDDATKKAQGSLEKLGIKINRTPKPTVTKAKQQEKIKMNEFVGGKPGDGYIGHPNLDIKNPLAKKQVKGPTGNQGLAGKLGDRKMKMDAMIKQMNQSFEPEGEMVEGLGQARKNVGASTCWDGYKAKGTKKKGGKDVPNCVKEGETIEEKKGLWDNIHAKRKRGESPAKKGDKDYPKTLNVEGYDKPDEKLKTDRDGYRISDKEAAAAKERIKEKAKKKKAEHDNRYSDGTGEESKKKKAALEKKRGMKLDGHPQFTRDDYNIYDIILTFLDENNLMESVEEAEEIMMQLTGAQIVEIIDDFMNDPSVVEQKATATDGHGNTYRDYSNDGLSDRQKRMKKFGDKRAAMLVKGV
jgi:hypothetical protein